MRRLMLSAALLLAATAVSAEPRKLLTLEPQTIEGTMRDDEGKVAVDVSGIACAPPSAEGARRCLLVNDEDRSAQSATLDAEGALIVGPKIPLIGDKAPADTRGEPAPVTCRAGKADFRDLDGEGVAYAAPYFYVTGSHGCARNGKFRESIFLLARLRMDAKGRLIDDRGRIPKRPREARKAVQLTFRLGEVLAATPTIGAYFGRDLDRNGVNIEGVAVVGDTLYAGLRAPALDGRTYIVGTPLEPLFAGEDSPATPGRLLSLPLGPERGVRDLAAMPDGRLLVLYGSSQDQETIPYGFATLDPRTGAFQRLGELPDLAHDGRTGKAEAVLYLGSEGNELHVMVLYDNLPNGMPRRVRLTLP